MDIKGNSGEGLERREESYREQRTHLREHIFHCEQNVARNMKGKDGHGEVSDGKEERVIGHWRKGGFCYKLTENMAELYSIVGRKVELVSNEF